MTDIQEDHDAGEPPDAEVDLDPCQQQVAELKTELKKALWEQGYFITMTCALAHMGRVECDCDDRIAGLNERLHRLQWE